MLRNEESDVILFESVERMILTVRSYPNYFPAMIGPAPALIIDIKTSQLRAESEGDGIPLFRPFAFNGNPDVFSSISAVAVSLSDGGGATPIYRLP